MIKMRMIDKFIEIYRKPKFVILNVIFAIIYYYFFFSVVEFQNMFVFITVPLWLIYLLILSSSILLTISSYSLLNSGLSYKRGSASLLSAITTFIGSLAVGCGCTAPIIFGLAAFGLSSTMLIALDQFFSSNQLLIIIAMIIINFSFIIYYTSIAKEQACKVCKNAGRKK